MKVLVTRNGAPLILQRKGDNWTEIPDTPRQRRGALDMQTTPILRTKISEGLLDLLNEMGTDRIHLIIRFEAMQMLPTPIEDVVWFPNFQEKVLESWELPPNHSYEDWKAAHTRKRNLTIGLSILTAFILALLGSHLPKIKKEPDPTPFQTQEGMRSTIAPN